MVQIGIVHAKTNGCLFEPMREKQIFPSSILEQSADQIFNERPSPAGLLYLTTLLIIVGCLVAINFICVDVNVQASGMIKPRENHAFITTTSSGFVHSCKLAPNASVTVGDTLLVIRSEILTAKLPALQKRQAELEDLIADLSAITSRSPYRVKLRSSMYREDVFYYIAQWNEADAKRKQTKAAYERNRKLFEANVIPLSEFEPVELEYNQAVNAIQMLTSYQKRQWQSDLIEYENELRDIQTQIAQIDIQSAETVITSPVTGSVQQIQTLFIGSYVTAGAQIAEISPDGDLIAECYLQPKDIGYMKLGMKGKLQVSAFKYTEWGMLEVTVDEVFDDVYVSADGSQSFYKVFCTLSSDHLTLKNGYEGYVKKGMLVHANFLVTRRTLFQLLYDKLDNWLNPNVNNQEKEVVNE